MAITDSKLKTIRVVNLICLLFAVIPVLAQNMLNLGFEPLDQKPPASKTDSKAVQIKELPLWYIKSQGHTISIDTTTAYQGKGSLLFSGSKDSWFSTVSTNKFSVDTAQGKILSLSVYTKKQGPIANSVIAFIVVMGKEERINDVTRTDTIRIDNKWQRIEIKCPINANAARIGFGLRAFGEGKVWFDQIEIRLDGVPYQDRPLNNNQPDQPVSPARLLSEEETKWLQDNHIPLQSVSPQSSTSDLQKLNPLFSGVQIFGLGEVTHGSREIFLMKHRLLRYLVEKQGVSLFAMEADMAAAEKINEYVLMGKGNPKQLLAQLGFWTWNTEEVLQMLLWMQEYNQKNAQKVCFAGVDMQVPEAALERLNRFSDQRDTLLGVSLRVYQEAVSTFRKTKNLRQGGLANAEEWQRRLESAYSQLMQRIETRKRHYLDFITLPELSWLKQQVTLLDQFTKFELLPLTEAVKYRDACMAENLYWNISRYGNAKTVLWAHNAHVSKLAVPFEAKPTGSYLKHTYGTKYLSIGFAFQEGSYRAIDPKTREVAVLAAHSGYQGTFEYFLQSIKKPLFMLDLRGVQLGKETQWLYEVHNFRNVGAVANENEFGKTNLLKEFDTILFINKSTAASGL